MKAICLSRPKFYLMLLFYTGLFFCSLLTYAITQDSHIFANSIPGPVHSVYHHLSAPSSLFKNTLVQYTVSLSVIAGLATTLGAIIVMFFGKPNEKSLSLLLGGAGGIMLAVVVFDLVPSSLAYGNWTLALTGFILGLLLMFFLSTLINVIMQYSAQKGSPSNNFLRMGYLIAIGIALHDLPEGMAIAVGYSAAEKLGILICLAIGLHNIPEGVATAVSLRLGGMRSLKIIFLNLAMSVFTPLGTLIGFYLVEISQNFIAVLLALAGGAMAYLVKNELIPASYKYSYLYASLGIALGFVFMVSLNFLQ